MQTNISPKCSLTPSHLPHLQATSHNHQSPTQRNHQKSTKHIQKLHTAPAPHAYFCLKMNSPLAAWAATQMTARSTNNEVNFAILFENGRKDCQLTRPQLTRPDEASNYLAFNILGIILQNLHPFPQLRLATIRMQSSTTAASLQTQCLRYSPVYVCVYVLVWLYVC